MVVREWGRKDNPNVVICLHGYTRSSGDFSILAGELSREFRVLCPDLIGRGKSSWLQNKNFYNIPQYISDLIDMCSQLSLSKVHIIGTSLGGLLGMFLATSAIKDELTFSLNVKQYFLKKKNLNNIIVESLILNDVGPEINFSKLEELASLARKEKFLEFFDFAEAKNYVKRSFKEFGFHSNNQWRILTEAFVRKNEISNSYIIHYDPAILASPLSHIYWENLSTKNIEAIRNLNLWTIYDLITCPTLLVRGEQSKILSRDIALKMIDRGPKPMMVEFEGVGHVPTLMHLNQISVVKNFLPKKKD